VYYKLLLDLASSSHSSNEASGLSRRSETSSSAGRASRHTRGPPVLASGNANFLKADQSSSTEPSTNSRLDESSASSRNSPSARDDSSEVMDDPVERLRQYRISLTGEEDYETTVSRRNSMASGKG